MDPLLEVRSRWSGRVGPVRRWSMGRHVHPDHYELVMPVAGDLAIRFDHGELVVGAGTAVLYRRGVWHAERALPDPDFELVYCSFDAPDQATAALPDRSHDRHGRIAAMITWMTEIGHAGEADQDRRDALCRALLTEYAAGPADPADGLIARIDRYCRDHLAEELRLADLAAVAALEPSAFVRRFRRGTGTTPMHHLRRLRVETACTLLASTPWTLERIAAQVGLVDTFHLSRTVKRVTGRTASSFRATRG